MGPALRRFANRQAPPAPTAEERSALRQSQCPAYKITEQEVERLLEDVDTRPFECEAGKDEYLVVYLEIERTTGDAGASAQSGRSSGSSSPSNPSTSPSPPSPSRHTPVAEDTGSSLPSKLALNFTQQLKHSVLPTEPKFDIREEYIGDPEDSTQSFTSQAGEPYVVIDERTKSDSDTSAESAGSSSGSSASS